MDTPACSVKPNVTGTVTLHQTADSCAGMQMYRLIQDLYPVCRSITGDGLRQTLRRLQEDIPLYITEVPSGTPVFDWTIPKEWNIREAWIKDSHGNTVVDFRKSNLHVLQYSVPVRGTMSLDELRPHLFAIPEHPDWIPYRTSYYRETWGFCLTARQLAALKPGRYEVFIDSTLDNGSLSCGECYLPGETEQEVLFSCHSCHPSLANDNLSGIAVGTFLAKELAAKQRRLSYRFLFMPGTIGAIAWLSLNRERASRIRHGLVLTCVGDTAGFHYKKSRRGSAVIDRAVAHVLQCLGDPHQILEYVPYGYDERQYCSPGFNLPVGCLMRSVHGTFAQYHTSADNLEFVRPESLDQTLSVCRSVVEVLEKDRIVVNQKPYCEPQLGKRGLYRSTGGDSIGIENMAKLWILSLADGSQSLLDIAERSGIPFSVLAQSADELLATDLLREHDKGNYFGNVATHGDRLS